MKVLPAPVDEPAADREPEAGAAEAPRRRLVGLLERFEQPPDVPRLDPHARVPHVEAQQPGRFARDAYLDLAALGERDRVRHQVRDHLAQTARIAAQRARHVGVELA
ncbi:MAG: hypothetical protein E6J87_17780 [Deltaproteobacteria bacterium]|nr:MAG: hypothetical protein E6J87_17780 [Deltaproteobacteria bacterium]